MTAIDRVLQIALAEEGYLEKTGDKDLDDKTAGAGAKNYTKYARDLDAAGAYNGKKQGYAWCTVFALWPFYKAFGIETALKMTCQPEKGYGASASWWAKYYKKGGRFGREPEKGAHIFFGNPATLSMTHMGIVYDCGGGFVYTVEGNTNEGGGVIANGGGVFLKKYGVNDPAIGGYGYPDYSLAPEPERTPKKLQILIPTYKEPPELIERLLGSIAMQHGVDFSELGVIIVADGTDVFGPEELMPRPFEVKYHRMEHGGLSAARNKALDLADAEYVMWCDADDLFSSVFGLMFIFGEIENGGFDAFLSAFTEETQAAGYVHHGKDITFVHGKAYRRQFLSDEGLRFPDGIDRYEDALFNGLAFRAAKEVRRCEMPFYLWCWRADSTVRGDPLYPLKTYPEFIGVQTLLIRGLLARGFRDAAAVEAVSCSYGTYYALQRPEWLAEETAGLRQAAIESFRAFWAEFEPLFDMAPDEVHLDIIDRERAEMRRRGIRLETESFPEFLEEMSGTDEHDSEGGEGPAAGGG